MTWQEAVAQLGERGYGRYATLCSDDWPNARHRDTYRREAISLAARLIISADGSARRPTTLDRVSSAIRAAARFAGSGFKVRSPEERGRILDICRACEHWNPGSNQCRRCGCYLEFKARMEREKCPIGKWP